MRQDVSESYNAEKVRVGVGICVHFPFVVLRFAMHKEKMLLSHCFVSQHQVDQCSFTIARAVLLRTCAVKSGEVDYGDCRHECDDEE